VTIVVTEPLIALLVILHLVVASKEQTPLAIAFPKKQDLSARVSVKKILPARIINQISLHGFQLQQCWMIHSYQLWTELNLKRSPFNPKVTRHHLFICPMLLDTLLCHVRYKIATRS